MFIGWSLLCFLPLFFPSPSSAFRLSTTNTASASSLACVLYSRDVNDPIIWNINVSNADDSNPATLRTRIATPDPEGNLTIQIDRPGYIKLKAINPAILSEEYASTEVFLSTVEAPNGSNMSSGAGLESNLASDSDVAPGQPTASLSNTSSKETNKMIIGIAFGASVVCAIIIIDVIWLYLRHKRRSQRDGFIDHEMASQESPASRTLRSAPLSFYSTPPVYAQHFHRQQVIDERTITGEVEAKKPSRSS